MRRLFPLLASSFLAAGCSLLFRDAQGTGDLDAGAPPALPRHAFVTEQSWGAGRFGGVRGADDKCNAAAKAAAALEGSNTNPNWNLQFAALLGDGSYDPLRRTSNEAGQIESHLGGWVATDESPISQAPGFWGNVSEGSLGLARLDINEHGKAIRAKSRDEVRMWRGGASANCGNWKQTSEGAGAYLSAEGKAGTVTCDHSYHLLCVELAPTPPPDAD